VGGQREDASAERPAPRRKKKIIAIQVLEDPTGGKTAAQLVRDMLRQANDPMSEMRNTMGLENLTGSQFYFFYCTEVQSLTLREEPQLHSWYKITKCTGTKVQSLTLRNASAAFLAPRGKTLEELIEVYASKDYAGAFIIITSC
jgi:hypothetical protein